MNGLPPPPLNIQPNGLLGFFGIKNGGRNPGQLIGNLQPTIDLLGWYANGQAIPIESAAPPSIVADTGISSLAITATSPVNLANGTNLIVPQTQLWYVPFWKVNWTMNNASGFTDATLELVHPNGPLENPPSSLAGFTGGAAMTRGGARTGTAPLFVLPGTVIQLRQFGTQPGGGGTVAFNFTMRIVRIEV